MAVAVVEQFSGYQVVHASVGGGYDGLGGPVPMLVGGACGWVLAVVVVAGWVSLFFSPLEGILTCQWWWWGGRVTSRPLDGVLGHGAGNVARLGRHVFRPPSGMCRCWL